MGEWTEKITVEFTALGVVIRDRHQNSLEFSAGEALMLLDILKGEEKGLRKIAEDVSPIKITIRNHDDI